MQGVIIFVINWWYVYVLYGIIPIIGYLISCFCLISRCLCSFKFHILFLNLC